MKEKVSQLTIYQNYINKNYPNMQTLTKTQFENFSNRLQELDEAERVKAVSSLYNKLKYFLNYYAKLYEKEYLDPKKFNDALSDYILAVMEKLRNKASDWFSTYHLFYAGLRTTAESKVEKLKRAENSLIAKKLDSNENKNVEEKMLYNEDFVSLEEISKNVPDHSEQILEYNVAMGDFKRVLNDILNTLKENERNFVIDYFGLVSGKPMTLNEIAKKYNLSSETVGKNLAKAIRKLRHPFRLKYYRDFENSINPSDV